LIHIGAHEGQEVSLYQQYNFDKVFLVEPILECVEIIKQKIKNLDNYEVFNYALGAKYGNANLYIADGIDEPSSSLLTPRESSITFSREREVELRTFQSLNLGAIDSVVIDTQGYEVEVLKGFGDKIYDLNFAIIEFANYEGYVKQPTYKELNIFMKKRGFIVVDQIKRINSPFPTVNSGSYGDALFVNTKYLTLIQQFRFNIKFLFLNNVATDFLIFTKNNLKRNLKKLLGT
jgi:FkbM family methyltransferase